MTATITRDQAQDLLYREALLLDTGRFAEWLDLLVPDVEFWMPAWRDETETTQDPDRELSLVYYRGRRNLEDRVMRLTSGLSTASTPLSRVVHLLSNVLVTAGTGTTAEVSAAFTTHRFDPRQGRTDCFFGRYEYGLVKLDDDWRIARKKIVLLNDIIPTALDINAI